MQTIKHFLTHPMYPRVCIEVNVAEELRSRVWIGTSKEDGFWQRVEYEGNINYCGHCGLMGHGKSICRKKVLKKQSNLPPEKADENNTPPPNDNDTNRRKDK